MISIVTATYNRAHLLPRLYESLKSQKSLNFEWIVVDDGSVDDTEKFIMTVKAEKLIEISYIKKNNGGKHTALNIGIEAARYDYIFFVDSDDILPENSIYIISNKIKEIINRPDYTRLAGICGLKSDFNGKVVGNNLTKDIVCSYLDFRYKYNIIGDKAEVFKKKILLDYKFPVYKREKFCPEALIWNRISTKYNMLFFNDIIYCCEYQEEGLSHNSINIRKNSPNSTLLYYYEFINYNLSFYHNFRALLNFWRFYYLSKTDDKFLNKPKGFLSMFVRFFMLILSRFNILF
ncbi:glycosyltransferase family 2 protein [Acinetobacter sp. Lyrl_1]|uniref:glycosyltransferase family 2 protein n=1 Tax=Acinetobacter sp. Lyrl_1 TaxID=3110920 RepID=UPI003F7B95BF